MLVENSRLGTIFHNCRSIRISGVSVSGFEEFYCIHIGMYGMSIIKCDCNRDVFSKIFQIDANNAE
jgi:hypothetical protein